MSWNAAQLAEPEMKLEQGYGREGEAQAGFLVKEEPDVEGTAPRGEDVRLPASTFDAQEDYDMLEDGDAQADANADEDLYKDYQLKHGGDNFLQSTRLGVLQINSRNCDAAEGNDFCHVT